MVNSGLLLEKSGYFTLYFTHKKPLVVVRPGLDKRSGCIRWTIAQVRRKWPDEMANDNSKMTQDLAMHGGDVEACWKSGGDT